MLDPVRSVLDEVLMDQLDTIHAQGPLRKKMRSEREIAEMPLGCNCERDARGGRRADYVLLVARVAVSGLVYWARLCVVARARVP